MTDKPSVIVLGGCGFIGRNLVHYLVSNNLVNKIRVADKVLPELAGLSKEQLEIFKTKVEFKQSNLSREAMVKKVFDTSSGKFDYCVNLAGETKYSQTDEVYKENIIDVAVTCGKEAVAHGIQKWIEVSTAQVYEEGKKPSSESDKLKPWTKLAAAKQKAEEELKKINGLKLIIVRPAIVYGPGDITGITPRIICGAVYKQLGETMEFLWEKDLRMNTVHVQDVCVAIHHLFTKGNAGDIYNLADAGNTDQGTINNILEKIYDIKTSFMGNIKSKLATSVAMKTVAETANEKHLKPWSDLCKAKGVVNTPLTPYLDEELLYNNQLAVDGTKITSTGFSYKHKGPTVEELREVIKYFSTLNFFPQNFVADK